jgi:hypothetical protein
MFKQLSAAELGFAVMPWACRKPTLCPAVGAPLVQKGMKYSVNFLIPEKISLLNGKGLAWYSPEPSSRLVMVLVFSIYMR